MASIRNEIKESEFSLPNQPREISQNELVIMERYKPVGYGRMGRVYKAYFKNDPKKSLYAIKFLVGGSVPDRKEFQICAQHEIEEVWKHLYPVKNKGLMGYEALVKINDYDENKECSHAILLEWCDGPTLLDYIKKLQYSLEKQDVWNLKKPYHTISKNSLIDWLINLLTGLKALHDMNVLHGDIAARNIMLKTQIGGHTLPVLIDPGDAVIIKNNNLLPHQKQCRWTPHEAPELRQGKRSFSTKSDIYALGVVFVELLKGRLFPAHLNNSQLSLICEDNYQSPSNEWRDSLCPTTQYGLNLAKILASMIHPDPNDRPSVDTLLEQVKTLQLEPHRFLPKKQNEPEEIEFVKTSFFNIKKTEESKREDVGNKNEGLRNL